MHIWEHEQTLKSSCHFSLIELLFHHCLHISCRSWNFSFYFLLLRIASEAERIKVNEGFKKPGKGKGHTLIISSFLICSLMASGSFFKIPTSRTFFLSFLFCNPSTPPYTGLCHWRKLTFNWLQQETDDCLHKSWWCKKAYSGHVLAWRWACTFLVHARKCSITTTWKLTRLSSFFRSSFR